MDEMTFTLSSPLTEDDWDAITDVDFEHSEKVSFSTKHGKIVVFVKEKTGEWLPSETQKEEDVSNGNYQYVCSRCGKSDTHAKTQDVPFCWWCGARMSDGDQRT